MTVRKSQHKLKVLVYVMIIWNIFMIGCILATYPKYLRACMILKQTQGKDPSECLFTYRTIEWVRSVKDVAMGGIIHPLKSLGVLFINRAVNMKDTIESFVVAYNTTIKMNTNAIMMSAQNMTECIGRFYINNIGQLYIVVIGMLTTLVFIGM